MAAGRVAADDTRDFLLAIRDKLSAELGMSAGTDSAVIARELRSVVAALAELDKEMPGGGGILDQLAARRAARKADAAG